MVAGGLAGKEFACNAGDSGLIPGLGRSPGERNGYPCQYSGLENSMNCIVPGVTKSWTQLSNFHFSGSFPEYGTYHIKSGQVPGKQRPLLTINPGKKK